MRSTRPSRFHSSASTSTAWFPGRDRLKPSGSSAVFLGAGVVDLSGSGQNSTLAGSPRMRWTWSALCPGKMRLFLREAHPRSGRVVAETSQKRKCFILPRGFWLLSEIRRASARTFTHLKPKMQSQLWCHFLEADTCSNCRHQTR